MKKERITVTIDDQAVEVTLRSSTVGDGSYHGQLLYESGLIKTDESHESFDRKNVGTYLYPHCIACVENPREVREMSLDAFMLLDEIELDAWAAASDRLNHHWWQAQADYISAAMKKVAELSAEAEKKIGIPSDGSPSSTMEIATTASHPSKS